MKNLKFKDYAWEIGTLACAIFNLFWSYPLLNEFWGVFVYIVSILAIVNVPFTLLEKSRKKEKKAKKAKKESSDLT